MYTVAKRLPAIYLWVAAFLYAIPDFNLPSLFFIGYATAYFLWPDSFLRLLTALLLGIITSFLFFAWISELREFGDFRSAIPLLIGGSVLIITHCWLVIKLIYNHNYLRVTSTNR